VDVPVPIAKLAGSVMEQNMKPSWTQDALALTLEDIVAKTGAEDADADGFPLLTLEDAGVEASSMDKVAFDYLHRFRKGGHFPIVEGYH
jgi:hypothetical protein